MRPPQLWLGNRSYAHLRVEVEYFFHVSSGTYEVFITGNGQARTGASTIQLVGRIAEGPPWGSITAVEPVVLKWLKRHLVIIERADGDGDVAMEPSAGSVN